MGLKYKVRSLPIFFMEICLVVSFYNYLLRPSPESDISLYRILQPLQIILLLLISRRRFVHWMVTVFALFFSGFFSIYLSGYPFSFQYNVVFFIHYASFFLVFFCAYALLEVSGHESVLRFLKVNLCVFFILGFVELSLGIQFSEGRQGAVRGMMLNENDFSLVLASGAVYFLFRSRGAFFRYSFLLLALFFSFINEARIISLITLLSISVYFYMSAANMSSKKYKAITILTIICAPLTVFLLYAEEVMAINFMGEGLGNIIFDPIYRIVTLTDYGIGYGSIFVRVDATIFALRDFFSSFGFGTGFGNTLQMLESGRHGYLIGLASLHNFPLQILVELGAFFVFGFFYFFMRPRNAEALTLSALLLILSLSQSAGVFSNYFFLLVLSLSTIGFRKAK